MIGVYAFYNLNIRDHMPPYAPLMKIGRGVIPDRYKEARKVEGTYMAGPYMIGCAKICEDDAKWETFLHNRFKSRRFPQSYPGCGIEFFRNVTIEEVRQAMEEIPGEWYEPPQLKLNPESLRGVCVDKQIEDSREYREAGYDELPCEPHEMYDFLHPRATKLTPEDFSKQVFVEGGVRNTDDYTRFIQGKKELPTLVQIEDGYFGRTGFRDLLETCVPRRDRR